MNWATSEGYNTNLSFLKFKAPRQGENEIFSLTIEELEKIENYNPEKTLEKVKDLFLFECYTGLRYSDLQNLRPENIKGESIEIVTVKTKQKLFIPLRPQAQSILQKYQGNEFALPQLSNQNMNEYLKDLAEKAGIDSDFVYTEYSGNSRKEIKCKKFERMTTHIGRHTFITLGLQFNIDPESVKKMTGHTSFKTFQKYIHYSRLTLIEQMKKWK